MNKFYLKELNNCHEKRMNFSHFETLTLRIVRDSNYTWIDQVYRQKQRKHESLWFCLIETHRDNE